MNDTKSILFITVTFPPRLSVASLRLYNYAKLFHENGWKVNVITCTQEDQNISDEFDLSIFKIIDVPWKDPYVKIHKIKNKYLKKVLTKSMSYIVPQLSIWLPDIRFKSWKKNAIRSANELIKKEEISHIYTSFSPPSPHLIGQKLKSNHKNIYWIAEYRDLWSFSASNNWLKKIVENVHFQFEKRIVQESDMILTVSKGQQEMMQKRLKREVSLLYNGCDFDSYIGLPTKNDVFNIVYTGNYSRKYNDLDLFFQSIKEFINNQKKGSRPIQVTFVGTPKNHLILTKIKHYNIENHCIFLKKTSNIEVKKIQKRASLLLHFAWTDLRQKGILSGKIFEYISAQKPILSIGFDQELSELIEPYSGKMLQKKAEIINFLENVYHNPQPIKSSSNKSSMISKQNQFMELEKIITK